ncbi:DUF3429 domain-containing protein [Falsiroseomonas sp.]|uniref:DUF3429 domain-containing protein n=1 Tax=Falsiroseomonas sp. TaxID=2870721 RepID=UPI0027281738|nr:DUF3429 domain-containing protein [Falsiroseomonas sp.]MDO9503331.1 DUF3429 domain-containing protein [Falsiroseomonas sp.]
MIPGLPIPAFWLGLAGLVPFLTLAGATLAGLPWGGWALAAYGATILAFLGAVHWGLALAAPAPGPGRFLLGVVPQLVGWVALLLPLRPGLALLAVAMLVTAAVESLAARAGLVPVGYLRLRWVLSVGAAACLASASLAVR